MPIWTTSNAEAGTLRSVAKFASLQRASGAPETYHEEPLSATIIPYFFMAVRMTRTSAGNGVMSKFALSLTRIPIGGSEAETSVLA